MKAQEQGFYDKKAEDFQVMEHFHSLADQKKEDIRHIFTLPFQKGGRTSTSSDPAVCQFRAASLRRTDLYLPSPLCLLFKRQESYH